MHIPGHFPSSVSQKAHNVSEAAVFRALVESIKPNLLGALDKAFEGLILALSSGPNRLGFTL
jgi:hypothetical protein